MVDLVVMVLDFNKIPQNLSRLAAITLLNKTQMPPSYSSRWGRQTSVETHHINELKRFYIGLKDPKKKRKQKAKR